MEIMRESSRWIRINRNDLDKAIEALVGVITITIPLNRVGKVLEFWDENSRERAFKILTKI